MHYNFKMRREFQWAVAVAVITVLAQAMLTFDAATIVDWRTWAVGILSAAVRAVGGALIAEFGMQATRPREEEGEAG